jgi:hypothetical protein
VAHPTQDAAIAAHRKAIADSEKFEAGNEIVVLKGVEEDTGKIVGGIKCCYYASPDVEGSSPYAAGILPEDPNASEEEKYRTYIMNEVLKKRVRDIKGHHARMCEV